MTDLLASTDDIFFALDHAADLGGLARLPQFSAMDPELVKGLIGEARRFVAEVVAPLNRVGDQHPSRLLPDGTVATPPGFTDAYRRYVSAGWGAVPFPEQYGGGGLPGVVATVIADLMATANLSFSLCPMLTQGAIHLLMAHGSAEQQAAYLPHLITGEWTGTMNLTEPDAGSDVGALRTRAEPAPDGSWRISGQKIFITYGDHDMAGNIVHLVLARVPGAPAGTRGISCFIVPKILPGGERNAITCVSLEDKLGIHGSPTCVLDYDGAYGELVGEANAGMRYMFTMMNDARLLVGVQGLGMATRSYYQALSYARTRRQGRGPGAPAGTSSPIVDHPDVRRMLMTIKSSVEALRALAYFVSASIDRAADPRHQELVDLLIPVVKGWGTDLGVEAASLALQVHGGAGYIEETGVAQTLRDARITPIYEGTNGIQAIDLVTRKLPMRDGEVVADLLTSIDEVTAGLAGSVELAPLAKELDAAVNTVRTATAYLRDPSTTDEDRLAGATPYLRLFGLVAGGWMMGRQALAAGGNPARMATARFYLRQILPQAAGLLPAVVAGAADLATDLT